MPTIYHVPTNTYLMDSVPIAEFLESTYPTPALPLHSELGDKIQNQARAALGAVFQYALLPREMDVISPCAQEYFRRTREAMLGHPLEDLFESEEHVWTEKHAEAVALGKLMQTHKAEGPFVLGARPSYIDFFLAG